MSSTTDATTMPRLTGRVKWFNNKDGFGFISVCEEGQETSKDIFVHWNSLNVQTSQYKYLVQGEYVEFSLAKPEKGKYDFHAVDVCGLKNGPLMCETRRTNMQQRVREGDAPSKPRVYRQSRGSEVDGKAEESRAGDFTTVNGRRKRGSTPIK